MNKDETGDKGTARGLPEAQSYFPLTGTEVVWRAKYLRPSSYLEHIPFLFWLASNLRPTTTVTLGLGSGVAHFAMCQAIERLGLEAQCTGLFLIQDDGATDVPTEISGYNEAQYGDFSRLVATREGEAAARIDDGSVDLLILEGGRSDESLDTLEERWFPRLGREGVVVFTGCGLDRGEAAPSLQMRLLLERYPHIRFEQGSGLALLMPTETRPARLERLRQAFATESVRLMFQRYFERMGRLPRMEVESQDLAAREEAAETRAREKEAWARQLKSDLTEMRESYEARHKAAAAFQTRIAELTQEAEARDAELLDLRQKLPATAAERDGEHAARRKAEAERDAARAEGQAQNAALEAELSKRFEEIAALTKMAERLGAEISDLREAVKSSEARIAEISGERDALQERLSRGLMGLFRR